MTDHLSEALYHLALVDPDGMVEKQIVNEAIISLERLEDDTSEPKKPDFEPQIAGMQF